MTSGSITFEDAISVPADVLEFESFRAWAHSDQFPQHGKISFIDGDIEIDMSPEELNSHNRVKRDVSTDLNNLVRQQDLGDVLVDGAFLANEAAHLATEPDLMFCRWESLRSGRVSYVPVVEGSKRLVEVRGTPDLVCEIVSKGSVRKGTVRLRKAYFLAGIPEYWLIDARRSAVSFQVLVRGKSRYVPASGAAQGFHTSAVLGRKVRLVRRESQLGLIDYRLLVRPEGPQ